jgi:dTDP-4-dehydrorhamnose 3,5-epimerase
MRQIYVPPGCAHGFCVTTECAVFLYKCTDYYSPKDERGILWNDPSLAIAWPIATPILSEKDQALTTLATVEATLPVYRP